GELVLLREALASPKTTTSGRALVKLHAEAKLPIHQVRLDEILGALPPDERLALRTQWFDREGDPIQRFTDERVAARALAAVTRAPIAHAIAETGLMKKPTIGIRLARSVTVLMRESRCETGPSRTSIGIVKWRPSARSTSSFASFVTRVGSASR